MLTRPIDLTHRRQAPVPPVLRALFAQGLAFVLAQQLAGSGLAAPWFCLAVDAALAAALGHMLGLPRWWLTVNAAFPIVVAAASLLAVDPRWYLAAFVLMAAVYWTTYRTQVPLYLSNRAAINALAQLLPADRPFRFLDAGAGTGTVLAGLAARFPAGRFRGVELAPIPWLIGRLRAARLTGDVALRRSDLWQESLAEHDVVYAFLSPVPMAALWRKVRAEMRPGSLFVSNTFEVPGVAPDRIIPLGDGGRALLVWRL